MDYGSFAVLPIVASGIVFMVVGGIWYGPAFGKTWMGLTGVTLEQAKATPQSAMIRMYAGSFVAALVASYVLSLLIDATLLTTAAGGMTLGVAGALGFAGTAFASSYLFNQKPLKLYVIDTGYQVVCLAIAGAILGGWR